MTALIVGTLTGLVLSGGLSTVVARGVVRPPARPLVAVRCAERYVLDADWRAEQLRQAALDPVPDEPMYWIPASLRQLVAQAHEQHLYTTLRQSPLDRPGMGVFAGWSWALYPADAELIGASA